MKKILNKKVLFVLIAIIVIVAIIISGVIIPKVIKQKQKDHELKKMLEKYYISKVEQFESENQTVNDVDVVFIGDSLTEG